MTSEPSIERLVAAIPAQLRPKKIRVPTSLDAPGAELGMAFEAEDKKVWRYDWTRKEYRPERAPRAQEILLERACVPRDYCAWTLEQVIVWMRQEMPPADRPIWLAQEENPNPGFEGREIARRKDKKEYVRCVTENGMPMLFVMTQVLRDMAQFLEGRDMKRALDDAHEEVSMARAW
jgi:hypothetical protein